MAIASGHGAGGIGVVRISGPEATAIARSMLGDLPAPRAASYRRFLDNDGERVDAGIAIYFPAPGSFTGEDVIELQGHGGPVVLSLLVESAIGLGARQALPGEFTQRAFLNGRLDLAQAEAVADLIESGTGQAARAAMRSLEGEFSKQVAAVGDRLARLRVHVEAAIDFVEEEIDFLGDAELLAAIEQCREDFDALLERTRSGRVLRDGYRVVIVGQPNAGKSSLLNYLSGAETAIVTEIAGTTRDILREQIDVDGLAVELVDTAGLRDNPDTVEAEGIRRARAAMDSADALLWIEDATKRRAGPPDDFASSEIPVIRIRNKIDLTTEAAGAAADDPNLIRLSAKTGAGIGALRERIRDLAGYRHHGEGAYTARRRHVRAVEQAVEHFEAGCDALTELRAGEILAEELRLARESLGEIIGTASSDELLGQIFSEFCIGK